ALAADDAATAVVADVTAGDVGLMQVDVVVKDADAAVVIKVTAIDDDVAVTFGEMNRVQRLADGDARDGQLHGSCCLDAARLLVTADDLQAIDQRRPLPVPDVGLH